jgi:uncharacterized protein
MGQMYAWGVSKEALGSKRRTHIRPLTQVGVGVVIWAGLYTVNEWFWDQLFWVWLGLPESDSLAAALHFFCYDLIKILLLVAGITFLVTVIQSFISVEQTKAFLTGKKAGFGHVVASFLGVVTPFCSCSSVPLFIGFVRGGIPLGITMTFLVASPLVSEIAAVLLLVYFGWEVAVLYVLAGVAISIVTGYTIQLLKLEHLIEPFVTRTLGLASASAATGTKSLGLRLSLGGAEAASLVKQIFPYLIVALAVGAAIHGWVPAELVAAIAGGANLLAVPMVVLLGVPLYGGAASVLPLIQVMDSAGVPVGTLLALMMSVIALSIPELILLKKVMKPKLLALFVSIVAASIIAIGYLFNVLL